MAIGDIYRAEDWLPARDARKQLGVTRRQLVAMVADGHLHARLLPRGMVVDAYEVALWLSEPCSLEEVLEGCEP